MIPARHDTVRRSLFLLLYVELAVNRKTYLIFDTRYIMWHSRSNLCFFAKKLVQYIQYKQAGLSPSFWRATT